MKDKFAQKEGWSDWITALENLSNCQNEYILESFIDDYVLYVTSTTA